MEDGVLVQGILSSQLQSRTARREEARLKVESLRNLGAALPVSDTQQPVHSLADL